MNRSMTSMASISILALTALSGTAMAQSQYQYQSSRDSARLAERSDDMKASLADAISMAEKHTDGVVIALRLTSDRNSFLSDANGLGEYGDTSRDGEYTGSDREKREYRENQNQQDANTRENRENKNRNDATNRDPQNQTDAYKRNQNDADSRADRVRDEAEKRNGMNSGGDWNRYGHDSDEAMFAIVTCVIDGSRTRDVVIDMSEGKVLGMQSVHASARNARNSDRDDSQYSRSDFGLVRASDLMNATVRNSEDDRIGDIDELAINPDTNHIVYGVLRRGGFLGFGESRYAVSTSELSVPRNGEIQMNLRNDDFEDREGFDDEKWPTQADSEWSTSWSSDNDTPQRASRIIKATDLIGMNVQCSDGKDFGEINDLVVEPRSGRVVYAIVDSERGEVVVPMSVLKAQGEERTIKMTQSELQAMPTLGRGNDPDWNDARWNRRIHDNYNTRMDLTSAWSGSGRP